MKKSIGKVLFWVLFHLGFLEFEKGIVVRTNECWSTNLDVDYLLVPNECLR